MFSHCIQGLKRKAVTTYRVKARRTEGIAWWFHSVRLNLKLLHSRYGLWVVWRTSVLWTDGWPMGYHQFAGGYVFDAARVATVCSYLQRRFRKVSWEGGLSCTRFVKASAKLLGFCSWLSDQCLEIVKFLPVHSLWSISTWENDTWSYGHSSRRRATRIRWRWVALIWKFSIFIDAHSVLSCLQAVVAAEVVHQDVW